MNANVILRSLSRSNASPLFVLLHNGMMSMVMPARRSEVLERVVLGAIVPGVDTERAGSGSA